MRNLEAVLVALAATVATLSSVGTAEVAVKGNDGPVLVCYVGTWAYYRPGNGKFTPEDIDPTLCTHLVYAFVGITGQGDVSVLDSWLDLPPPNLDGYNRFLALKKKNPDLKVLISVGGWNQGSYSFSTVANSDQLRKTFAKNVLKFVTQYGFDGFDVDWEYPALRGGASSDKAGFVELLRELRAQLEPNGLLLTAAVSVGLDKIEAGYDVEPVVQQLDLVNLMVYDLHGSWDSVTGMNAALKATKEEKYDPDNKNLNVESALKLWLDRGADPSKVVLGVPFYGHTWTLRDASNAGVYAPTNGPGQAGPYTREGGTIGYNEVCVQQDAGLYKEKWDSQRLVPYAVEGNQWVSYDNVRSLKLKAQLAVDQGLAGVMVWSLETDDFRNDCSTSGGRFPLLRAIYSTLHNGAVPTAAPVTTAAPTPAPTAAPTHEPIASSTPVPPTAAPTSPASARTDTPTATPPTTPRPPSGDVCTVTNSFQRDANCKDFYFCFYPGQPLHVYRYTCGPGTLFNEELQTCDFAAKVPCP
ncbi:acidic mammalian chitinase-like isoform X9 [Frankliniella occidentalis]|uniref:chitinase n=1 Tax=Frankliniella occidentalis TaxID=133901 RepID=A0A9C6XBJ6_FRAOC|nr:acidic mammalian chitinase-like isoform X9 [Frankliniella occidentalis]